MQRLEKVRIHGQKRLTYNPDKGTYSEFFRSQLSGEILGGKKVLYLYRKLCLDLSILQIQLLLAGNYIMEAHLLDGG